LREGISRAFRWGLWAGLGLVLGVTPAHGGRPWFPAPRSDRVVHYELRAELRPADRTVTGWARLRWRNATRRSVDKLCFHMYMNAFRNGDTLFMREGGGPLGRARFPKEPEAWGWVELRSIRAVDGGDLSFSYDADGTVLWVSLPRPVEPGEEVRLEYAFETRLPRIIARTGYAGSFFMVAQWFPKVGVLEERGWNCHPFHANSEFYADFGVYDVEIRVPRNFVVGATGEEVGRRDEPTGETTYRYYAEDVHDFAWTASPSFRELRDRWRHVQIRILYPPGHEAGARRIRSAVRAALDLTAEWYGPYPYPVLTVVEPPLYGLAAAGMEYPTLFTVGLGISLPAWLRFPETIAIHEFGHQYWYGLVANNEFEAAWMDEGLNSYMEARIVHRLYGPRSVRLPVLGLWGWHADGAMAPEAFSMDPPNTYAWQFVSRASYNANSYSKPMLALLTLERLYGPDEVTRALRSYFQTWQFRHPYPTDFLALIRAHLGEAAAEFLRRALDTTDTIDFQVAEAGCTPARRPPGFYGYGPQRRWQAEAAVSDRWRCSVLIRRRGTWAVPVEVQIRFRDGRVTTFVWDGQRPWFRWMPDTEWPAPIERVDVDPAGRWLLEVHRVDNGWVRSTPRALQGLKNRLWGWLLYGLATVVTLG
jgi:hypothetical protein